MIVKLLIFPIFIFSSTTNGKDADSPNPLTTVTEMMVRFFPSMQITEFTCTTRYNVSQSQKLILYYKGVEKYEVADTNQLIYTEEDAQPGEYKCKVGKDEAVFNLDHAATTLNLEIVELAFQVNLVTEQVKIGYETVSSDNSFSCYQDDIEMKMAFYEVQAGVEIKEFNGAAEPKIKTNYKCYIRNDPFQFSFTNKVDDLYPRINNFQVTFVPSDQGLLLNMLCQSRTVPSPKIKLFINKYTMVENKRANAASYTAKFSNEFSFKCIVENDYGRDVIIWDNINETSFAGGLNTGDAFFYEVDPNKQITKMIYRAKNSDYMDRVNCSVAKKNKNFQYNDSNNVKNEKIFIERLDKRIIYKCQFKNGRDFETVLYTKDSLHVSQISDVRFKIDGKSGWDDFKDFIYINCIDGAKSPAYAIGLYSNQSKIGSLAYFSPRVRTSFWTDALYVSRVHSAQCIVESDMGYDTFTVLLHKKLPKLSTVEIKAGFPLDGNISLRASYFRENPYTFETTNCSQNGQPAEYKKMSFSQYNRNQSAEYACNTGAWVNCMVPDSDCHYYNSSMDFGWSRKLTSYFPDGTLKRQASDFKFDSHLGFFKDPES